MRRKLTLLAALCSTTLATAFAADHGDAPIPSNDQAMDLGDVYAFLDPNDNTKLILGMTFRGFIVPGEAVNFGFFDNLAKYAFELETTGDAKTDSAIEITFSQRTTASTPQTATIKVPGARKFSAITSVPTLGASPNTQSVTTDPASGVSFFAGEIDDPFFFDIPAFGRFSASVRAGTPDATQFNRGRDSFAGYNINAIALSIPVSVLKLKPTKGNPTGTKIGVQGVAQRRPNVKFTKLGQKSTGDFRTIDRMGNPGLNVLVNPFARKNEYNQQTTEKDAKGTFATDIVTTLKAFGANDASVAALAGIYVSNGDLLRIDTAVANSGLGGGDSSGAGFPNGRRLKDDVVDTFLTVVANGTALGDNVNASDISPRDTFPFFAPPQQPFANGTTDDNTRN